MVMVVWNIKLFLSAIDIPQSSRTNCSKPEDIKFRSQIALSILLICLGKFCSDYLFLYPDLNRWTLSSVGVVQNLYFVITKVNELKSIFSLCFCPIYWMPL